MARALHCPDPDAVLAGYGFRTASVEATPTPTVYRCEREGLFSSGVTVSYAVVPEAPPRAGLLVALVTALALRGFLRRVRRQRAMPGCGRGSDTPRLPAP